MDLEDFSREINVLVDEIETNVNTLMKQIATGIDQTVVMATPVDTGRARANWTVTLNTRTKTSHERTDFEQVLVESKAVIDQYGSHTNAIYITNNLAYIGKLNEGSSAQAPAGFVEIALHEAIDAIDGAHIV